MIDDVATEELARIGRDSADPDILLTLSAGGNDLLDALAAGRKLESAVRLVIKRYIDLVETVREELPRATLILTTVYDPTDGTGRLPGLESYGRLPLEHLDRFNRQVRRRPTQCRTRRRRHAPALPAPWLTAPESERWYWDSNLIEPNARGASEIRRVWWEIVEGTV